MIQKIKKNPYVGCNPSVEDTLKKNKDLVKTTIDQINQYKDEIVTLYCKKKELERTLKNFSYYKESGEYNLEKNEKINVEKRLRTICGTISPFTDKGKQMLFIRSKEENIRTYSRISCIVSKRDSSLTGTRPLKAILDQDRADQRDDSTRLKEGEKVAVPKIEITHV